METIMTLQITRRTLVTSAAALPLGPCATTHALAAPIECDRETLLRRYNAWLHMERRMLSMEAYPELGGDAEDFIPNDREACAFHFPPAFNGDWRKAPKPSTRAALVLGTVGVSLGPDHRADPADEG